MVPSTASIMKQHPHKLQLRYRLHKSIDTKDKINSRSLVLPHWSSELYTDLKLRSLSICPVLPVRPGSFKWNARVLKTGSGQNGPAHGSEPLSSPEPVGQSAGIWRVMAGKMYARALDLSIQTGQNQFFSAGQN